jgi:hypothetical protein
MVAYSFTTLLCTIYFSSFQRDGIRASDSGDYPHAQLLYSNFLCVPPGRCIPGEKEILPPENLHGTKKCNIYFKGFFIAPTNGPAIFS